MGLMDLVKISSVFSLLFWGMIISADASAATRNIYSVVNQEIDETAANEVEAKKKGLENGKKSSFIKVLKRIVRVKDYARLPQVDLRVIEQAIMSTSLPEEKFTTGDGRYLAKLNVHFRPEAIRKIVRQAGIPYAEAQSRPLLVLPVYRVSGTTLLWEDGNQWFDAWADVRSSDALVPLVLPLGDITDVATISSLQAARGNSEKLLDAQQKYDTAGTVVTIARIDLDPADNLPVARVFTTIQGQGWEYTDFQRVFSADAGMSVHNFLHQVAIATSNEIIAIWKQKNLLDSVGTIRRLTVFAPLQGLQDWVSLREKLSDIAGVRKVALESLRIDEAVIYLDFLGKSDQLQSILQQNNISLDYKLSTGKWILKSQSGVSKYDAE